MIFRAIRKTNKRLKVKNRPKKTGQNNRKDNPK
jgi:hypothetical protein